MVIGPGAPGSSCPVPVVRVPHHTIFDGFWAGVATPVSERFPESLENGGFCDSLSAIPRNEKAHIPLCGTTKATQCIFPMFFPWCGHPGTASLARQSAAKSGRFSLMERRATAQVALRMRGTRDRPRRLRMQTAPLLASRLSPPARAPLRITPFSAPRRRRSRRPHLLWMTRRVCG